MSTKLDFDPDAAASGDGIFGLPFTPETARVVILPVPFEATTSYGGGTANGPSAVLAASRQVDLFDAELGPFWSSGIAMLPIPESVRTLNDEARAFALPVIAAGGAGDDPSLLSALEAVNQRSRLVNDWVRSETIRWRAAGKLVGVLGGDHSVPLGSIQAHALEFPGMGILHLDAHADLRVAYEGFVASHASIMHNVLSTCPGVKKLVQVGIRDLGCAEHLAISSSGGRIVTFFDAEQQRARIEGRTFSHLTRRVVDALPPLVYLSFDIDGLDPTLCPHTGTPVPGGLSFAEVVYLLSAVVESGRRIVGFDLVEVAPGPDGDDWDGNVGARLLYKMVGYMLKSQPVT